MMANAICKFCGWEFDPEHILTGTCDEHKAKICPACYTCQAHPVTPERVEVAVKRRGVYDTQVLRRYP